MPEVLSRSRRDATKRQIMGVLQESTKSNAHRTTATTTTTTTNEHVTLMCQDMEAQLEGRIEIMRSAANKGKEHQNQIHKQGMVKIKKAVRKMTVKEFNEANGCDILELIRNVVPPNKKRIRTDLETPAPKPRGKGGIMPPTTARTVRRGEAIL